MAAELTLLNSVRQAGLRAYLEKKTRLALKEGEDTKLLGPKTSYLGKKKFLCLGLRVEGWGLT